MRTLAPRIPDPSETLEPSAAPGDLTARLKSEARRLGFDQVGIAPAVAPAGYGRYAEWLRRGHQAGMAYLERQAHARAHPEHVLEGVRTVVVAGFVYGQAEPNEGGAGGPSARVARYARGGDYHNLLWRRLEGLLAWLQAERPGTRGRAVSDTAPLLEREFAQRAGLGWVGKNTMLIDRRLGSYTVLGALLTDADLTPDAPFEMNHCGTCTRCLDACPTDAFVGPYQLDSRRCLSYWTIEHRGPIPDAIAGRLEGWVFGCDICQEVCPWNRKAPAGHTAELGPRPEWRHPDLIAWLEAEPAAFTRQLKGTALARAKRSGLLRNAALVLGERGDAAAVPALVRRLTDDDPVVRGAVAWALGQIATRDAIEALRSAEHDPDDAVRQTIARALARNQENKDQPPATGEGPVPGE